MRLSQNHEMLVYTEILDALAELHRRQTRKGGQHVQFQGDLCAASEDDLFELYAAAHHQPERAVECLEELAESERRPSVRAFARRIARWERELVAASDRREEGGG